MRAFARACVHLGGVSLAQRGGQNSKMACALDWHADSAVTLFTHVKKHVSCVSVQAPICGTPFEEQHADDYTAGTQTRRRELRHGSRSSSWVERYNSTADSRSKVLQ